MTDKTDLTREIHEYVTAHGEEDTATHLLVQAASAIQAQAAELEAVGAGGVQALSAAPAGWKLVPEDATKVMVRATDKVNFANADTDGTMHNVWNAMLAASPTPPALSAAPAAQKSALRTYPNPIVPLIKPVSEQEKMRALYLASSNLMAYLGRNGAIHSDGHAADAMMDCLNDLDGGEFDETLFAASPTPPQEAQEPTVIDQKTMELAESVGLIGPTSRTHDLHAAIQRFHDLICVEATVKAACMAADILAASPTPPAEQKACDTQLFKFYGVSTTAELIAAQARHVEKLQAKLPPTPSFAPQRMREG